MLEDSGRYLSGDSWKIRSSCEKKTNWKGTEVIDWFDGDIHLNCFWLLKIREKVAKWPAAEITASHMTESIADRWIRCACPSGGSEKPLNIQQSSSRKSGDSVSQCWDSLGFGLSSIIMSSTSVSLWFHFFRFVSFRIRSCHRARDLKEKKKQVSILILRFDPDLIVGAFFPLRSANQRKRSIEWGYHFQQRLKANTNSDVFQLIALSSFRIHCIFASILFFFLLLLLPNWFRTDFAAFQQF